MNGRIRSVVLAAGMAMAFASVAHARKEGPMRAGRHIVQRRFRHSGRGYGARSPYHLGNPVGKRGAGWTTGDATGTDGISDPSGLGPKGGKGRGQSYKPDSIDIDMLRRRARRGFTGDGRSALQRGAAVSKIEDDPAGDVVAATRARRVGQGASFCPWPKHGTPAYGKHDGDYSANLHDNDGNDTMDVVDPVISGSGRSDDRPTEN